MNKKLILILIFFLFLSSLIIVFEYSTGIYKYVEKSKQPWKKPATSVITAQTQSKLSVEAINFSGISAGNGFVKYFALDPLEITIRVPQYNLPLSTSQILNYNYFLKKVPLSREEAELMSNNGFVVIQNSFNKREDSITQPYSNLKYADVPIFVTSDSLLHVYHLLFDETLRQIEEREFYDSIWGISMDLFQDSVEKYNNTSRFETSEALRRNVAYFSVALELLKPNTEQVKICSGSDWKCKGVQESFFRKDELDIYSFNTPLFVKDEVEEELALIRGHVGLNASPLFVYKEDYSQYVPRGHYASSERLKNYFKAVMWYGRMSMLLKGTDQVGAGERCVSVPPCKALISEYDAQIQTMQASLIADELSKNQGLLDKWERIYTVTSFYVGFSDDLGPYEYIDALNSVFDGEFDLNDLSQEKIGLLKAKLAEHRPPKIYGGTGLCTYMPPFTPEQADECLDYTKGFRFMGQRFIPDSYMFSNLISPYVGDFHGKNCGEVFTCESTLGGPQRVFPRGLDVMALLGSSRAADLLIELGDTEYSGRDSEGNNVSYETAFNELRGEFNGFDEVDWNRNLYWSWLHTLKPLLNDYGGGYPTFMQTRAWQDKSLTTALASWAELRHDTILYAKQSSSGVWGAVVPREFEVVGYVEPVPEFYNRLLALTRMTKNGLSDMDVLDNSSKRSFNKLDEILQRLVNISTMELENEILTQSDYDFIKNFGDTLDGVISDVPRESRKTTIIADVHTDLNTKQVLEEGVGPVKLIVVAYMLPDGRILVGAGPVMTYYEFKHPLSDRLTDDGWKKMLASNPPKDPEWVGNYAV
ncbi:MAG: DUF3160 domain-containing protein [Methanobacteriota archaeon]